MKTSIERVNKWRPWPVSSRGGRAGPEILDPLVLMGVMTVLCRRHHRTVASDRRRDRGRTTRERSGFTLVELLIVAGIIVLLAAILLPSLGLAKELGNRAVCAGHLRHMGIAMAAYADSNRGNLLHNYDPDHPYAAYYDHYRYPGGKLIQIRLACLYEADLVSPRIFYCPTSTGQTYKRYNDPAPWGTLPQEANRPVNGGNGNQWVRTTYTYYPQAIEKDSRGFPRFAAKAEQLDPGRSMITDNFWSLAEIPHIAYDRRPAMCAVFGDGHAAVCTDAEVFDPALWFIDPNGPNTSANRKTIRPTMIEFKTILSLLSAEKG